MNNQNNNKILLPLLFSGVLVIGIWLGNFLNFNSNPSSTSANTGFSFKAKGSDKIRSVLNYILKDYVDTLDEKKIEDDAINALITQLDPHSAYIPAKDLASYIEPLEGNFDGIGIEFNIQNDTILVVAAISGGPSEALGISSGDRIVKVDDEQVAGIGITNEQVMKKLRGKRNTKVKVQIVRRGIKEPLEFVISRGQIPIFSLDVSYMISSGIGYMKISRFAATTFQEYLKAFDELKDQGMKKLILDLRDNPGGYLNAAVDLCDEFLEQGNKIVYTQGKARKKEEYNATSEGGFEKGGLVVLVDEGSASASEILAGAIQDNDRGWVVGRRSFGKGLVQEEMRFNDGSAIRLTIARYYTPSGRCIQKPYDKGIDQYYQQLIDQVIGSSKIDSSQFDSTIYETKGGRIVYGGGGINPDYVVDRDTTGYSRLLADVARKGLFNSFSIFYVDQNRKSLQSKYPDANKFRLAFNANEAMEEFKNYINKNEVPINESDMKQSSLVIKTQLKAFIGRVLYGNKGYFPVIHERDPAIKKALELLNKNMAISARK